MKRVSVALAIGFQLATFGCTSKTMMAERSAEPNRQLASTTQLCAKQHVDSSSGVIICDQLFPKRPYMTVPAPQSASDGTVTMIAALSPDVVYGYYNGGVSIVDAQAKSYHVIDDKGALIKDMKGLPKNLKMPNNRFLFTVYQVQGSLTPDGSQIKIASMKPFAEVTGCALDNLFLGDWEGTSFSRTETGFNRSTLVPLSIQFDHLRSGFGGSAVRGITDWKGQKVEANGDVFILAGTIQNMGGLSSDPFKGASTSEIDLYRITTMHIPGDNHIAVQYPTGMQGVSPTGMGSLRLMTPENLIRQDELTNEDWAGVDLRPHAPGFGPGVDVISLHPVHIGAHAGDSCPSR